MRKSFKHFFQTFGGRRRSRRPRRNAPKERPDETLYPLLTRGKINPRGWVSCRFPDPPNNRQVIMSKKSHENDHIDPIWKDGRDYQLVCGLDSLHNTKLRTTSENARKANRFLPWRVSQDDFGCAPVNQGDLCLFLDPDTNEWVLEEFLGKWWFKKTRKSCGASAGGRIAHETGRLERMRSKVDKPSQLRCARAKRDPEEHSEWGKRFALKTNTTFYRCLVTGFISTAGPLSRFQRKRGIDTKLRVKV